MSRMADDAGNATTRVRFFLPTEPLRPYITTYYAMEIRQPPGQMVEDFLHPEWANLRVVVSGAVEAAFGGGDTRRMPRVIATGPTSQAARFRAGSATVWGIGLLPLGWARLVEAPAHAHADRFCDGAGDPAFARFADVFAAILQADGSPAQTAARIDAELRAMARQPAADDARIAQLNGALVAGLCASVGELCEQLGVSARTLERISRRAFGFPPKLLLRRQRFLRSMAQYMLDPSLKWLNAIDWQYHDQAHFTRDFRRFMGMGPRQYAALDHPVLLAAAFGRAQATGVAVQALHSPAGG